MLMFGLFLVAVVTACVWSVNIGLMKSRRPHNVLDRDEGLFIVLFMSTSLLKYVIQCSGLVVQFGI